MTIIPKGGVEKRLGVIEGLLAKSSVARDLRVQRAAEEAKAARLAAADVLAADAAKRRTAGQAEWWPLARAYREAITRLVALNADLGQLAATDARARADLDRANEARDLRAYSRPGPPSLDAGVTQQTLAALDETMRVYEGHPDQ